MRTDPESQNTADLTSSSFEKTPKETQDYPLHTLNNEGEYLTVGRGSSESTRSDHREPLLPTTSVPRDHDNSTRQNQSDSRFSCSWAVVASWIKGPQPPRKHRINPWLLHWQTAPSRLIDRYFASRNAKIGLLLACIGIWGIIFLSILHWSVAGLEIPGYGTPVRLSCHTRLWNNATDCGLDGDDCRPFDNEAFAFRCPAGCAAAIVLEPYTIGAQEINYRSRVIGGSDSDDDIGIYRGDSLICPAALHAGLITDQSGGCGILRRTGEQSHYPAVHKNGISSVDFPSNFPLSFTFEDESSTSSFSRRCGDLRWRLFAFSVAVTALLSLCIASPAAFYASIFFIVYFQVALVSDPPYSPDYHEIVSTALGRFLPTAFVGFAIYHFCVRHTLRHLDAYWEKTILWVGGCWVGGLETDTFDRIPISRLTPHDIQQQPGALPALLVIVGLLVSIVATQALAFRFEGRLPAMLKVYGIMVCGVLALLAVPSMNLRLHHYILGLLFLPGTTLQTRPSLLYQGILVGLFVNGVARWGYDSILQTPGALLDGARLGSVPPQIAAPAALSNRSLLFDFAHLASPEADGISVLVNDVERFREFKAGDGAVASFNWTRRKEDDREYFRFGYIRLNALGGIWYEDFSKPVIWEPDGYWNESVSG